MKIGRKYLDNIVNKFLSETIEDKTDELMEKLKFNPPGESFDYIEEGDVCEQCGGEFKENECMECGSGKYMMEGETCECGGYIKEGECMECGMRESEIMEKLSRKQKTELDVDDDDKITAKDFEYLRRNRAETKGKKENKEGNAFTNMLKKTPKGGKFNLGGKTYTDRSSLDEKWNKNVDVEKTGEYSDMSISEINSAIKKLKSKTEKLKESGKPVPKKDREKMSELYFAKRAKQGWKGKGKAKVKEQILYRLSDGENQELFTENEIIDMIENIVLEQKKTNIKKSPSTAGYSAYEKAFKESGKENKEYLDSVAKKMVDYIKDGSKGKYETNPKHFPKGNGQLEKMATKKYTMSKDGDEFLDDYMRPGMEALVPDEIQYDEDWVSDNIKGSSRTGNNPEWANAEETELGEKINKKRKNQKYHKAKMTAYRKTRIPVTDGVGENSGQGVKIKTESMDPKIQNKLNEEFHRMKSLMGYDDITQ